MSAENNNTVPYSYEMWIVEKTEFKLKLYIFIVDLFSKKMSIDTVVVLSKNCEEKLCLSAKRVWNIYV